MRAFTKEGTFKAAEKHLPELKYLYSNMIYIITAFDVDGFICVVVDGIPADFWKEGIARCRKIKEDIFMLNEGRISAYGYIVTD